MAEATVPREPGEEATGLLFIRLSMVRQVLQSGSSPTTPRCRRTRPISARAGTLMPPTHDKTGRARRRSGDIGAATNKTTSRPYRRRNKIDGQFAWRLIEMLESPAFRVLSLSARRVLDRTEVELARHSGNDNGRLPVTFDDFHKYGIHRHAIAPAIREAESLGFVEITERGRAGNAEFRAPNKFRLTYRPTDHAPTDEWRRIRTIEEAEDIGQHARGIGVRATRKRNSSDEKRQVSVVESVTESINVPVPETVTTAMVRNPSPLSIFQGGRAGEEPLYDPALDTGSHTSAVVVVHLAEHRKQHLASHVARLTGTHTAGVAGLLIAFHPRARPSAPLVGAAYRDGGGHGGDIAVPEPSRGIEGWR